MGLHTIHQVEGSRTTVTASGRAADREFQLQLGEAKERDKRRKNVVIMGIPEQQEESKVGEFVTELFEELAERGVVYEVMGRVGKVVGSKSTSHNLSGKVVGSRPVRVSIEEVEDKRKILNRAELLKEK